MKKAKLDLFFFAGIAFGCLSLFLIGLPGSNWFVFAAALIALVLMTFSFSKPRDKR